MLVSMVCMLSVSDMLGSEPTEPKRINPREAMEKIKENQDAWEEFNEIFEDHKGLIKRNCFCCGDINIEKTELPQDLGNFVKSSVTLDWYIDKRFILDEKGKAKVDPKYDKDCMTDCDAFNNIILKIYGESPVE